MNSRTQAFALLLFGGALLRLASGDALLRYVRPVARPWALLAGVAIAALALWSLVASARPPEQAAPAAADSDAADGQTHEGADAHEGADSHGHGVASRVAWLAIAPVVAILVIAPPALGSYSAAREAVTVTKPAQVDFPALTSGDAVRVGLLDFATRALWDDGRTLKGRTVTLAGFVLRTQRGGFVLSRLAIACCAADARPIDVGITTSTHAIASDTWVTVTGTYGGISPSDATLPTLNATSVTVLGQPRNPYDD